MNGHQYEDLASVLARAYDQASGGKGRERHANGRPFLRQPIIEIGRMLGGPHFELGQAIKKTQEASGMLQRGEPDRCTAELLGAINYLAAAIILIEETEPGGATSGAAADRSEVSPPVGRPPAGTTAPAPAGGVSIARADGTIFRLGDRVGTTGERRLGRIVSISQPHRSVTVEFDSVPRERLVSVEEIFHAREATQGERAVPVRAVGDAETRFVSGGLSPAQEQMRQDMLGPGTPEDGGHHDGRRAPISATWKEWSDLRQLDILTGSMSGHKWEEVYHEQNRATGRFPMKPEYIEEYGV